MSPVRYARQYVLPEIGTEGQARIEAMTIAPGEGDARAIDVALAYLERGGAKRSADGARVSVPSTDEVARIAGRADLVEAAAFLVGALAATRELARAARAPATPTTHLPTLSR